MSISMNQIFNFGAWKKVHQISHGTGDRTRGGAFKTQVASTRREVVWLQVVTSP